MAEVPGVVDLSAEAQADIPTLKVRVDPAAAARQGLETGAVAEALQTARVGHTVGQVLEGQIAFPLVVRYALDDSTDLQSVGTTQIQTPDRRQIPLSAVATIQQDRGPNFVMRENVQRRMVVQSNVTGRDLRSVVNDIQARVGQNVTLPQGYHVEYGGQFESEAQASRQLLWLSAGVIVAIFFILSTAFGSSRDGLLIMLNLPLALIGGVVGVYLAGGVLSVASIVGFITLFGIATRNGIMLVSHIRHLQEHEGVTDFRTAVIRGATERVVPILMTALAAGLALVPIALSAGRARQRDSGTDGHGHHVRFVELHCPEHGGRTHSATSGLAVRSACAKRLMQVRQVTRRGPSSPIGPCRRHSDSSARNHAFAIVHSRTTVAAEIPTTSATSSIVSPPK